MADLSMLKPGEMFGDLRVVRELGRGGMGAVYLVEDEDSHERYAAKILFPEAEMRNHDLAVGRFVREAEIAMSVDHPNLVRVYDVGRDPETGLGYMIMDYLPGGSLQERLVERLARNEGPFKVREALLIIRQIASALVAVEHHGIVHRDIKPDNILFDENGVPKLADLGIAKRSGAAQVTLTLTATDMVIGTPAYMSPEQLQDSKHTDIRSDIYSLGIVLWQMLAGERPHADATPSELMAKALRKERIPDIRTMCPKMSRRIVSLLRKMTSPKLVGRFQHPGEILTFLDEYEQRERLMFRLIVACATVAALVAALVAWHLVSKSLVAETTWKDEYPVSAAVEAPKPEETLTVAPVEVRQADPETSIPASERKSIPVVPVSVPPETVPAETVPAEEKTPVAEPTPSSVAKPEVTGAQPEQMASDDPVSALLRDCVRLMDAGDETALSQAVNAARRLDPELAQYDWEGRDTFGRALAAEDLAVLRRGKVYFLCWQHRRQNGCYPSPEDLKRALGL